MCVKRYNYLLYRTVKNYVEFHITLPFKIDNSENKLEGEYTVANEVTMVTLNV